MKKALAQFLNFSFLSVSRASFRVFPILAFFMPLMVRALPELLMGGYIVGFDTISYYVPVVCKWVDYGVGFWEFFGYAPLFYMLLYGLSSVGISLTVSLKVFPTILHGFLGLAIFGYATKGLGWSSLKGLFVSLLATLYFVGLRISWDMLRSELGLIFLFIFLMVLQRFKFDSSGKRFGVLLLSMLLVALSHQLVSVIMFVIVFAVVLEKLLKRNYSFVCRLLLAVLPALVVFGLTVYAYYGVLPAFSDDVVAGGRLEWLSLMGYSSTADGIINTFVFLFFCYLPFLPFIVLGMRKFESLELKAWFVWCLVGVLLPFFFVSAPLGYRWILLLCFPFAFLVVEGFGRLSFSLVRKALVGFAVLLSFSFVLLPAEAAFPYFGLYPCYVPSSMLQNSVPLSDCTDVVKVLSWVEANADSSVVLLVHDAFYGWALLYADGVKILRYGYASPEDAALTFSEQGCGRLFLVWWVSGEGWHGQTGLSSLFKEVFRSGRIAVYKFGDEA